MNERALGPPSAISGGKVVSVEAGTAKASLFVPDGSAGIQRPTDLWVHFHSAPWYVIGEYQRAGHKGPVAVFDLGQGSETYAKPFRDRAVFGQWLAKATESLGVPSIGALHFTSFSAGYGAVRELIQVDEIRKDLKTVILCDSLYGSLLLDSPLRTVVPEHYEVWHPLVDQALAGQTTVIMTTSQITPSSYAGTWEVARALVASKGGQLTDVAPGSCPAASVVGQPLIRRFDRARWFVWSYEGETPVAHMTHARRLAELIQESKKQ